MGDSLIRLLSTGKREESYPCFLCRKRGRTTTLFPRKSEEWRSETDSEVCVTGLADDDCFISKVEPKEGVKPDTPRFPLFENKKVIGL